MMRLVVVAALLIAHASISRAADVDLGSWNCVPTSDAMFDLVFRAEGLRLNNISLSEDRSLATQEVQVLNLSAAAANRSTKPVVLSIELAGFNKENELTFALSGRPLFDMVSAGKTEEVKGSIYIEAGRLQGTTRYCARVVAGI